MVERMGRKKKNLTQFKDFESSNGNNGYETSYIRMTHIQLVCVNELSANAFRLYMMMKDYARGESEFKFPHRIYKKFVCNQTFKTARQELIDKGYLETYTSQKAVLRENKYKFSSGWRNRNEELIKRIIEEDKGEARTRINKKENMV